MTAIGPKAAHCKSVFGESAGCAPAGVIVASDHTVAGGQAQSPTSAGASTVGTILFSTALESERGICRMLLAAMKGDT
jgi:hypothetical protein